MSAAARPIAMEHHVNPQVRESASEFARQFREAQPFRHVVIDHFLDDGFCSAICAQFPEFRNDHAINENSQVGGKATRESVRALGDAFLQMDDLVRSPEFLGLVEGITGIRDLQYDPFYFGGGTHENRNGQDLDPHIDFNYHPVTGQHRRLNLIIYLNEGWQDEWGGSLQFHRNPYLEAAEDQIITVTPTRNRCVIFETTEHSWHGFERIELPPERKDISRKSFAVYYYTDTRPESETAEEHSTIYAERHLPDRFRPGMILADTDIAEIKRMLKRRDGHLQRLYRDIQGLRAELNQHRHLSNLREGTEMRLEEAPTDLVSAVRMIRGLRHQVKDLEASTSWRITAPLRAIKRLLSGKP